MDLTTLNETVARGKQTAEQLRYRGQIEKADKVSEMTSNFENTVRSNPSFALRALRDLAGDAETYAKNGDEGNLGRTLQEYDRFATQHRGTLDAFRHAKQASGPAGRLIDTSPLDRAMPENVWATVQQHGYEPTTFLREGNEAYWKARGHDEFDAHGLSAAVNGQSDARDPLGAVYEDAIRLRSTGEYSDADLSVELAASKRDAKVVQRNFPLAMEDGEDLDSPAGFTPLQQAAIVKDITELRRSLPGIPPSTLHKTYRTVYDKMLVSAGTTGQARLDAVKLTTTALNQIFARPRSAAEAQALPRILDGLENLPIAAGMDANGIAIGVSQYADRLTRSMVRVEQAIPNATAEELANIREAYSLYAAHEAGLVERTAPRVAEALDMVNGLQQTNANFETAMRIGDFKGVQDSLFSTSVAMAKNSGTLDIPGKTAENLGIQITELPPTEQAQVKADIAEAMWAEENGALFPYLVRTAKAEPDPLINPESPSILAAADQTPGVDRALLQKQMAEGNAVIAEYAENKPTGPAIVPEGVGDPIQYALDLAVPPEFTTDAEGNRVETALSASRRKRIFDRAKPTSGSSRVAAPPVTKLLDPLLKMDYSEEELFDERKDETPLTFQFGRRGRVALTVGDGFSTYAEYEAFRNSENRAEAERALADRLFSSGKLRFNEGGDVVAGEGKPVGSEARATTYVYTIPGESRDAVLDPTDPESVLAYRTAMTWFTDPAARTVGASAVIDDVLKTFRRIEPAARAKANIEALQQRFVPGINSRSSMARIPALQQLVSVSSSLNALTGGASVDVANMTLAATAAAQERAMREASAQQAAYEKAARIASGQQARILTRAAALHKDAIRHATVDGELDTGKYQEYLDRYAEDIRRASAVIESLGDGALAPPDSIIDPID